MIKLIRTVSCLSLLAAMAAAQTPAGDQAPAAGNEKAAPAADKAPAAPGDLKLVRSALCTAISDREPVGALDKEPYEFKSDVTKVFFFNEISTKNPPQKITHKWFLDDKPVAEVPLDLKYERNRTWSSKSVAPGNWKVEVVSDSGESLGSASFKVTP